MDQVQPLLSVHDVVLARPQKIHGLLVKIPIEEFAFPECPPGSIAEEG